MIGRVGSWYGVDSDVIEPMQEGTLGYVQYLLQDDGQFCMHATYASHRSGPEYFPDCPCFEYTPACRESGMLGCEDAQRVVESDRHLYMVGRWSEEPDTPPWAERLPEPVPALRLKGEHLWLSKEAHMAEKAWAVPGASDPDGCAQFAKLLELYPVLSRGPVDEQLRLAPEPHWDPDRDARPPVLVYLKPTSEGSILPFKTLEL
jgi:hypothetical protein